jgi:opacity protein-like surface antigen
MKRIALAAAAACLVMGSAQAQQAATPWYGELGYIFMRVDAAGTSAKPGALRGIVGYNFGPYWSVEGLLGTGVSDSSKNVVSNVDGLTHNVTFKTDMMYGLLFRPRYNFGNGFEVFGRFGWAYTKIKTSSDASDLSGGHSDSSLAWGAGANYYFTPQWYAGLDFMQYSMRTNHRVDGMTLSVGYRW